MVARARFGMVLVVATAGCLSGGPPPRGQRAAEGRFIATLSFLRAGPESPLLLWQSPDGDGQAGFDVHLMTSAPGGDAITDRLLLQHAQVSPPVRLDSRGRLPFQLRSSSDSPVNSGQMILVDIDTDELLDLGQGYLQQQSPSGDRLIYNTADGQTRLHEIDDRDLALNVGQQVVDVRFLGEDLYYDNYFSQTDFDPTTPAMARALWRIVPEGAPEPIADGVTGFGIFDPFVSLTRNGAPGASPLLSILDPMTLKETAVPATRLISVSPDGRWILATTDSIGDRGAEPSTGLLFDPLTGAAQTFDLPGSSYSSQFWWRPGRDGEVWIPLFTGAPDGARFMTLVVKPGAAPVEIERQISAPWDQIGQNNLAFSRDGAYFFAYPPDLQGYGEKAPISVVSVDAPTSPGFRLNPEGSGITSVSEVAGGRLLVETWYKDPDRSDLMLVDVATGTSRLLGEAGSVVAIGERRVLATLHKVKGAGDLTLIDFDTGATTKLGESVVGGVVERHDGSDALSPGTRVGYILKNPIASPYDGAWVVTLP